MATKSKKVAVSKTELEETAAGVEAFRREPDGRRLDRGLGRRAGIGGGEKVRRVARSAQTAGTVVVMDGVDDDRRGELARSAKVVAAAGVLDVAEGIEPLATSEDIHVQSAVVASLSSAELARAMELGSSPGSWGLPAPSCLRARCPCWPHSWRTRATSCALRRGFDHAAGRPGAAQAMAATGAKVSDMGANEVAEGLVRMAVAEEGAQRSADLFVDGAMKRGRRCGSNSRRPERGRSHGISRRQASSRWPRTEAIGQAEAMEAVAEALDVAAH